MKKSKKLLTLLLAALLVFSMLIMVACDPPGEEGGSGTNDKEDSAVSDGALISNGTFANATGTSTAYIKTNVTGWALSSSDGSWSSSAHGLECGVVDLSEKVYSENKSNINATLGNPGVAPNTPRDASSKYTDTNALVISMSEAEDAGSIFFSASTDPTVKKGKYYKLSVDVWTHILDADGNEYSGAAIVVRGDAFVEYLSIDTDQAWQTYEVYIEGSDFEDRKISIELWLGHGPDQMGSSSNQNPYYPDTVNPYLAKGTVFFDNVILEELSVENGFCAEYEKAFDDIKAAYNASDVSDEYDQRYEGLASNIITGETFSGKMTVISFVYPDPNFTAYREYDASTTSTSYTRVFDTTKVGDALNYTWVLGKKDLKDSDEFPVYGTISNSYLSYSTDPRGIFDLSKLYTFETDSKTGDYVHDDSGSLKPVDMFHKLSTSFVAPDAEDFYDLKTGEFKALPGSSADSEALLIYHINNAVSGAGYTSDYEFLIEAKQYYVVSVWVYIWVPEIDEPQPPEDDNYPELKDYSDIEGGMTAEERYEEAKRLYDEWIDKYNNGDKPLEEGESGYDAEYKEFYEKYHAYRTSSDYVNWEEKYDLWEKYCEYLPGNSKAEDPDTAPKATLRLSGADVDDVYGGVQGEWKELKMYVQGNALADRKMQLELWYGEGEWGADTLYPGGCFFDNLTIRKATPDEIASETFQEISVIESGDYEGFGLTAAQTEDYVALDTDDTKQWYYAKADDRSSDELVSIGTLSYAFANGSAASEDPALSGVAPMGAFSVGGSEFNVVMVRHNDYTASTLYFKPAAPAEGSDEKAFLTLQPNHFYRLSMWVKTVGLTDSTFGISVYDAATDAAVNSSASVSGIGQLDDWTELSVLFMAGAVDSNELYIVVTFGSGDIFTPENHAKGTIYLTAFTFGEVTYTEYNDASTGTYTKKASLSSSSSYGSVTNGNFSGISTDNFDDDVYEELFDKDGNLKGVADPGTWTESTPVSPLTAPTVTETSGDLTWKGVNPGVTTGYYVFMNDFVDGNETRDGVVVAYIAADSVTEDDKGELNYTYDIPVAKKDFYVRAVAVIDGKIYISPASTARSAETVDVTSGSGSNTQPGKYTDDVTPVFDSFKSGIVNYKNYMEKGVKVIENIYSEDVATVNHHYRSTASENLLMISSGYETYAGYQSASTSFSANSYYRVSVWVKTVGNALASVTLQNTANALSINTGYFGYDEENNGRYEGYVNISTGGVWKRFDLYVSTGMSSVSAKIELYLGNKYAENTRVLGSGEDTVEVSYGLSSGTVYFDDVYMTSIDESTYNMLVYGVKDPDSLDKDALRTELETYGIVYSDEDFNTMTEAELKVELLSAREYRLSKDEAAGTVSYEDMFRLSDRAETGSFFDNEYIFKLIVRRTDSFDNFDERDEDEIYQGNDPASFDHYNSSSAETGDDDEPTSLNGVYDRNAHFGDSSFVDYLLAGSAFDESGWTTDTLKAFLQGGADANDRMVLMMANIAAPSGQYFQSSSSFSFSSESYYKITFQAKYLALGDAKNSEFRFVYDNSNGYWQSLPLEATTGNEYETYTFYFHNASASSVSAYLYFNLGSNDALGDADRFQNFVSGIALIDNLTIEKMDEAADGEAPAEYAEYMARVEAGTTLKTEAGYVKEAEPEEPEDPDDGDKDGDGENGKVNPQVWLIVSSVLIGVIIIAVIIVLTYRKLKDKVKKKLKKTKVESKVPTDLEERAKKKEFNRKLEAKKKDIDDLDDYND